MVSKEKLQGYKRKYYEKTCRSIDYRYSKSFIRAKSRKKTFSLDKETYIALISLPCHYCRKITLGQEIGIGLDRIDNEKGYEVGNVLPCCKECNKHRQDTWTVKETEIAIDAVLKFRKG